MLPPPLHPLRVRPRLHVPVRQDAQSTLSGLAPPAIGLLGGSFNPAHGGHRHVSVEALKGLGLEQVWWLVSPQNPLKPRAGMAPFPTRLQQAKIVASHPRIRVTDIERRFGTVYTVDTVSRLMRCYPYRFVWIIGADNLLQMAQWRRWRDLAAMTPIAVFDRSPYSHGAVASKVATALYGSRLPECRADQLTRLNPPVWTYIHLRPHPASSTAMRNGLTGGWLRSGQDDDHVPAPAALRHTTSQTENGSYPPIP
ncbi:MAG: nicotinate-nucleotide adenylyltransferase [Geminicoccaceae bacterium]|nr:nicotinate-nucleotide adenylyltransferase [Geminicoccaceae bacterium]